MAMNVARLLLMGWTTSSLLDADGWSLSTRCVLHTAVYLGDVYFIKYII